MASCLIRCTPSRSSAQLVWCPGLAAVGGLLQCPGPYPFLAFRHCPSSSRPCSGWLLWVGSIQACPFSAFRPCRTCPCLSSLPSSFPSYCPCPCPPSCAWGTDRSVERPPSYPSLEQACRAQSRSDLPTAQRWCRQHRLLVARSR